MPEGQDQWYAPGSEAAIENGCLCPIVDNRYGQGYLGGVSPGGGFPVYVMTEHCPLHGKEFKKMMNEASQEAPGDELEALTTQLRQDPEYREAERKLTPYLDLASTIVIARARHGWTQRQLARQAKVSKRAINRLEMAEMNPRLSLIQKVADALQLRIEIVVIGKGAKDNGQASQDIQRVERQEM